MPFSFSNRPQMQFTRTVTRIRILFIFYLAVSQADGFTNPTKTRNGSDPFMVYYNGYYYLTTTTWTNIQITRSHTIEGFKTATAQTVWTNTTPERCCQVWAPEMHRINGQWYIYYTAGISSGYSLQRQWVLQGPPEGRYMAAIPSCLG